MWANYNSESRQTFIHQVGGRPQHGMRAVGRLCGRTVGGLLSKRTDGPCRDTTHVCATAARKTRSPWGSRDLSMCLNVLNCLGKLFNCLFNALPETVGTLILFTFNVYLNSVYINVCLSGIPPKHRPLILFSFFLLVDCTSDDYDDR